MLGDRSQGRNALGMEGQILPMGHFTFDNATIALVAANRQRSLPGIPRRLRPRPGRRWRGGPPTGWPQEGAEPKNAMVYLLKILGCGAFCTLSVPSP